MNDLLKDVSVTLLSLALISGFARHRAEHAVISDMSRTISGGELYADVKPKGLLGLLVGQSKETIVWGKNNHADRTPFRIVRGPSIRAKVDLLKLDFTDITLRGVPVKLFHAEIPDVSLDLVRAMVDKRILIKSAGEGIARATVDQHGLEIFIAKKFPQITNPKVQLLDGRVRLQGKLSGFGPPSDIDAIGKLQIDEGKFANLVDTTILLNNKPVVGPFAQAMLKMVNPVIDVDKDLGLDGTFYAVSVEIANGIATVYGKVTVPNPKKEGSN